MYGLYFQRRDHSIAYKKWMIIRLAHNFYLDVFPFQGKIATTRQYHTPIYIECMMGTTAFIPFLFLSFSLHICSYAYLPKYLIVDIILTKSVSVFYDLYAYICYTV